MQRGYALLRAFVCTTIRLVQELIYRNESEFEDRHITCSRMKRGEVGSFKYSTPYARRERGGRNGTLEALVMPSAPLHFGFPCSLGESSITCIARVRLTLRLTALLTA
jgi:hypothetical protein